MEKRVGSNFYGNAVRIIARLLLLLPAFMINICETDHVGLMLQRQSVGYFQKLGVDEVIGIEEVNKISPCQFQAVVASHGKPLVLLGEDFDAGIFCCVVCQNFAAAVGRAVVDTDCLKVGKSLAEDGIQAAR